MNILLIGNGFDLEHNLPTSYNDFLRLCKRVIALYNSSKKEFKYNLASENLDECEINEYIRGKLFDALNTRKYKKTVHIGDENFDIKFTTDNKLIDEMYSHIKDNVWLEYFCCCSSFIGESWIDFEAEISRVVQIIDTIRNLTSNGGTLYDYDSNNENYEVIEKILSASKMLKEDVFNSIRNIDKYISNLNNELERLIRALEIYIAEFIHGIAITKKSADIEKLNVDHVLSFNYSDTYDRVYGKEKGIEYSYIHGKADINNNVKNSDLVLGIDEYLDDENKDKNLEFLTFKKFYQRIYKSTGNNYLDWVDDIKDGYADYQEGKKDAYKRTVDSFKQGAFDKYPLEDKVCKELLAQECPEHNLYIFGHSLDVTDKDILKLFICNDNVQTKIFYYRENEDDRRTLGMLIRNLTRIMGQDELIRRTGGTHKTIEFIPQSLFEQKE